MLTTDVYVSQSTGERGESEHNIRDVDRNTSGFENIMFLQAEVIHLC